MSVVAAPTHAAFLAGRGTPSRLDRRIYPTRPSKRAALTKSIRAVARPSRTEDPVSVTRREAAVSTASLALAALVTGPAVRPHVAFPVADGYRPRPDCSPG